MDDLADLRQPPSLAVILKGTLEIGWVFGSDPRTGSLLRPGGLYVVDDMISFPSARGAEVAGLRAALVARPDLVATPMGWASGLVVCARR